MCVFMKVSNTPEWKEYMSSNAINSFVMNSEEYAKYNATLVKTYETFIEMIKKKKK